MMRLAGAALVCTFSLGCAESEIMPAQMPIAVGDTPPPAPAVADSFDAYVQRDEATRPRPRLTHSLSLGYTGNEPLSGSVMRDTPMPPPSSEGPGQTWQQYVQSPSWPPAYHPPYAYYPPPVYYPPYDPYSSQPQPRACSCAR